MTVISIAKKTKTIDWVGWKSKENMFFSHFSKIKKITYVFFFVSLIAACGGGDKVGTSSSSSSGALGSSSSSSSGIIISSSSSSSTSSSSSGSVELTLGEQLYIQHGCAECHGPEGNDPILPISRGTSLQALTDRISQTMPVEEPGDCVGSCASEIASLILSWEESVGSSSSSSSSGVINLDPETLFAEKGCDICHGPRGENPDSRSLGFIWFNHPYQ